MSGVIHTTTKISLFQSENKINIMNPVFYQYHREKNILDSLIHEFAKREWLFDEMPTDYFHQYRWPDIVLSDKEAVLELPDELKNETDKSIELLGCYEPDTNRLKEGRVVLFVPKIHETTKEYIRYLNKDNSYEPNKEEIKKYVELLTTLVLIHEFTHWIVQAGVFRLKNNTDFSSPLELKYDDKDSIFFHETIAQIFTNYICCKDEELKGMFFWLEEGQPIQYRIYGDLLRREELNKNHFEVDENDIELIIFILIISIDYYEEKSLKRQSYREFEKKYKHFKHIVINGYFSDSKEFLNKFFGHLASYKYGI
jgi:hypothetical protein